jgi:hypothetical protein
MDFEAIRVDGYPIDTELADAASVGHELAHSAHGYLGTPRALVWRNPSSDWRLFVLLLPLASRLSLMTNPIFSRLTRDWGLHIRFLGVDPAQRLYDFRGLLTDSTLKELVAALAHWLHDTSRSDAPTLDVLFGVLARNMLTIVERRRRDWARHLARERRLEPQVAGSLFDRAGRYPEFVGALRQALRQELIDVQLYGRVLRSIDLREMAVETRVASIVEGTLDPVTLAKLGRSRVGKHAGCYNWLLLDPRRAAPRNYVLGRLPAFAQFFADALIDAEPLVLDAGADPLASFDDDDEPTAIEVQSDLRRLAPQPAGAAAPAWLKQAIDSGQDRAVIVSLARHFAVSENVIRALWRQCPAPLGAPPTWHLVQILRRLDELPERSWPRDEAGWLALMSRAIPAAAH